MANVLTDLAADIYKAADVVGRGSSASSPRQLSTQTAQSEQRRAT